MSGPMAQPEFLRRSLLIALAPLLVGLLVFLFLYAVKIAKWVDWRAAGREGVATVKAVPIRGAEQYLFIRGHDRSKPVLLFLPGGPGESVVPLERIFSRMLEKHFVVAQVEFGVGRAEPYRDAPTIHEFAADAEQMVDALRASYGERPVYLAGSSLGAIQALLIAQRSPEKIAAVVTIGQPVDWAAGNELAAAELARRAAARNDRETLSALAALPRRLVLDDDPLMIDFAAVKRQRALLAPYGMETVLTRQIGRAHV